MKVRIQYEFQGRKSDYITSPPEATTPKFEDYKAEVLRWFPDAIVEIVPEEIIEFELNT